MKKVILALFALALVASPAFASVQNIKVSGDIDSTYLLRDQFNLGINNGTASSRQDVIFTQTRLRVDADLTDNVSATVRLLNERVWGNSDTESGSTDNQNNMDLSLAYVKMREMLYSPLTVTIGRQEFAFGNSLVVDSSGTNNNISNGGLNSVAEDFSKRTAQDAVRLTFDYNPLTVDVIASKISSNNVTGVNPQKDDVDLLGTNMTWEIGDELNTKVESYFWAKIDNNVTSAVGSGGAKADTVYTPGVRSSLNVMDGLSLQAEAAMQLGNKYLTAAAAGTGKNIQRNALAGQLMASYSIPGESAKEWAPVINTAYTYVSGDKGHTTDGKNPANGEERYTAWDPMFENQGGGTIYNTMFDLTNMHIANAGLSLKPMQDVTTKLSWSGLWLAKEIVNTRPTGTGTVSVMQGDGTSVSPAATSNKKLGDELDLGIDYDYTEDVKIGMTYGLFWPGNTFADLNQDVASQTMVHANVNF